jgi:hypothetical protein
MYLQRGQRDNREQSEKVLVFIGQLSEILTSHISKQSVNDFTIDNSIESMRLSLLYNKILDEMIALASKGWFSSISFYEFYKKGGLHNVIEFYQTLVESLQKVNEETISRSQTLIIQQITKKLHAFIHRFILEDDRANRDSR